MYIFFSCEIYSCVKVKSARRLIGVPFVLGCFGLCLLTVIKPLQTGFFWPSLDWGGGG